MTWRSHHGFASVSWSVDTKRLLEVVTACAPSQDAARVTKLIAASMWYGLLEQGQDLDASWVESMVALVEDRNV